ncbi:MAG: hypothetical protein ACPGVE_08620 [Flavobacteriales bacterium]
MHPMLRNSLTVLAGLIIGSFVNGGFFLIGGIYMTQLIRTAPLYYKLADLGLAYLPAAYLGYYIAKKDLA